MHVKLLLGVLSLLLFNTSPTAAYKASDFKTCSQSGFCRRGRDLASRAKEAGKTWRSRYAIVAPVTVNPNGDAVFKAGVKSSLYPEINFSLELRIHEDGVVRVRMDEEGGLKKRYDETSSWALVSEPKSSKDVKWKKGKKNARASFGHVEVVIQYEPLKVTLLKEGNEQVVLNGRGLLHMEHFRTKSVEAPASDRKVLQPRLSPQAPASIVKLHLPSFWRSK